MCRQDEENTEDIKDPREVVQTVQAAWRILGDEEVEHCYHSCVPTEHIVTASTHASQSHT